MIEIMGKHSNIILLDRTSNKIIEAIKHVGFSQNSYRTILPGSTYVAPPKTDAVNPLQLEMNPFALLHKEELSPKPSKMFPRFGARYGSRIQPSDLRRMKIKNLPCLFPSSN